MAFKFKLKSTLKIECSGEVGEVKGRAEYDNAKPQYLLRYASADGRGVESWWDENALIIAE